MARVSPLIVIILASTVSSCTDFGEVPSIAPDQVITVTMKNTDTFHYPTVGGDEDGAVITKQALHYRVSEIRRGASTNFIAVFVYQPETGYVGSDRAEIEVRTGSDGARPPTSITHVGFRFSIAN